MSRERIVVSFDDEDKQYKPNNPVKTNYLRDILFSQEKTSLVKHSCFKNNSQLTGQSKSHLLYPDLKKQTLRISSFISLEDRFLNSLIEDDNYLYLSSTSGKIYVVSKNEFKVIYKKIFNSEKFEKS